MGKIVGVDGGGGGRFFCSRLRPQIWILDFFCLAAALCIAYRKVARRRSSQRMVRSYERHEATAAFGLIGSNAANAILDADGKTAYLPALEDVLVWDVKRGEQVRMVL